MALKVGRPNTINSRLLQHYVAEGTCCHTLRETAAAINASRSRLTIARTALETAGLIRVTRWPSLEGQRKNYTGMCRGFGGSDRVVVVCLFRPVGGKTATPKRLTQDGVSESPPIIRSTTVRRTLQDVIDYFGNIGGDSETPPDWQTASVVVGDDADITPRLQPHQYHRWFSLWNNRERAFRRFSLTFADAPAVCQVCGTDFGIDKRTWPHIDHDHTTGELRGFLCGSCNRGLGMFKDDPQRLRAAVTYLAGVKDDAMDVILEREVHPPAGLRRTDDPLEETPSVQFHNLFVAGFKRKFGSERGTEGYRWGGKDMRLAKQLTDAYGLDMLEVAVKAFFAMDGYGAPTVGNFAVRCEELMVTVQENLALQREQDSRPEEEKRAMRQASKAQRIAEEAMEIHGATEKDIKWLRRYVARWTDVQRFAKRNRYIMRAALTDEAYEEYTRERKEYEKHGR